MIRLKRGDTPSLWWIEIGKNTHIYPVNYWGPFFNRLTGRRKYKWYPFEIIKIDFEYSDDANWCPGLDVEIVFLGLGLRFCTHDRSSDVEDLEDEKATQE